MFIQFVFRKFQCLILALFCFSYANGQTSFKVMTYNIRLASVDDGPNHWHIRKSHLMGLMNYYHADIIGLQEAQKPQLDYLLKEMPDYVMIGSPRTADANAEYAAIFYNKLKYKVSEEKTFWLSQTPESISKGWDAAYHRVATYALFQDIKTKKKFWVINTHFDNEGKVARNESAKMLLKTVEVLQKKVKCPLILTGDFNARPEENTIQNLAQNMVDTRTNSMTKPYGEADTWTAFKFNEKPNGQIDFIFASKYRAISVKSHRTIADFYDFKYPSDHLPVMVEFEF
jgi:endonuclease/exonuclease/phosphatase family metal-dependent hydrolase